jgi:hypothetical protein
VLTCPKSTEARPVKKPKKHSKTLTEAFTSFTDFEDEIDDLDLLGVAKYVWKSPEKHQVIKEIQEHSPRKRKDVLAKKLNETVRMPPRQPAFSLTSRTTEPELFSRNPSSETERRRELSNSASKSPTPESPSQTEDEIPPDPASGGADTRERSSPPASPKSLPRNNHGIRSDPYQIGDEDDTSEIQDGGIVSRRAQAARSVSELSRRSRWTMKTHSNDEDDGRWQITWAALRLDLIQHGPPPSDEESESRLTNDHNIRKMIRDRYNEVFGVTAPDLTAEMIESVTLEL